MLTLNQGNSYSITFNILNDNGSVKDLSGTLDLKYSMSRKKQTKPLIELVLADAALSYEGSDVTIKLESSLLNPLVEGAYYHELWQVNALGDPHTLMSGKLTISSKLIKE